MPHALTELKLAEVTRAAAQEPAHEIRADVCVVGAGIAGLSAAIESARLHRDVVLVDSLPLIGGQMVHSLIGLFCGVFGNGPDYLQLTHGILDDIFRDLSPSGDLHFQSGHTMTVFYNEVALGRWLERAVRSLSIKTVLGTVLQHVAITDGRINAIDLASRYGNVQILADGFVDASGDAALTWQAGLPCWVPERTIYGSQHAVARTAWPIELHDRSDGYVWEMFGPDHMHYVPLRALTPPGAHNLVAAGRCADGDAAALSSVRVMGPCAAMGAGAAHALDLAARTKVSVHDVDLGQLHERLAANLDPPP